MVILFLKNLAFTIIAPGTVAGLIPWWITRSDATELLPFVIVGITLIGIGAAIYLWCVWDFATFGRGTPAPIDAPKKLVVRGLYRYTRNPMYVGVLTALAGWAVMYLSEEVLAYGLCAFVAVHLFVVLYEEPHLRRVFGSEYKRYLSQTPRWLPTRNPASR
ncbi:MAG: isoprenylcysteine carboxyl methyltransferase [Armatimonadetes bacterium]|nr:isoprenylcysteine carboxyl methyltransferase [Armatimonadota bacterium]